MTATLIIYCVLIAFASLVGGWIPLFIRLTHRRLELLISFVAGAMLAVGLLHLLPHAVESAGDNTGPVYAWALAGFLIMFFLERFFCYHHHEVPCEDSHSESEGAPCRAGSSVATQSSHRMTWSGAAVGLSIHSLTAGVALAASMEVASDARLAGMAVFLVIVLHKPFDSLTLTTLMSFGEWSRTARHVVNNLFALMVPLGAILFCLGAHQLHDGTAVLNAALAFSAGTFLCIAASDLLPELHFHSHDRLGLSTAMLLGVALAVGIGILEHGSHDHSHGGHGHQTPHEGHNRTYDHRDTHTSDEHRASSKTPAEPTLYDLDGHKYNGPHEEADTHEGSGDTGANNGSVEVDSHDGLGEADTNDGHDEYKEYGLRIDVYNILTVDERVAAPLEHETNHYVNVNIKSNS